MHAEVRAVLLTVSYADEEVEITFDREGLDHLIRSLTSLQKSSAPDHEHLMTEEWGSWELTTAEPGLTTVAHHLRLELVGAEGGRDEIGSRDPVPRVR
jgi:hypothetical protein